MELDDKILIVTKLLDEIYRECTSAKVILAGDLNVKAKEKDENRKGEFDEMRKVLEEYNIFFRSDTSGKIATHFN